MTKKFKPGGYETLEQVQKTIEDLRTNPKYDDMEERQKKMFMKDLLEIKKEFKNKPSLKAGGMVKKYKHGGSVKAGRLAKRGYGAAKK